MNDEIDIREYLEILTKRWALIAAVTIVAALLTFFFSVRMKPVYEAKTTILMRSDSQASGMSQVAGIAGMLGINLGAGGGNLGDLTELLKSRVVAEKVLDDLDLRHRIKGWDGPKVKKSALISVVNSMIKPPKSTVNMLEIKTEADDPQIAADVANGYVSALTYYWNDLRTTTAQKKLKYIEDELPDVENNLKMMEAKLKLVPRSYSGLALSGQSGLQRDYDIYTAVYIMLKKELESTKLEASKDIPPFSVVDPAERPENPSRPKVKVNVMIGAVVGLFLGIFLAFFQEYWITTGNKNQA
ncbi:MAG TPA: Wzz/FepE/Etk N-terminal domain-containing protein [Candidatus Omnitrophota bacterium]|nr:Wzz/FepE/Etk N-terminal domain-containing protein [Candidatus Omnitrophota bacterium]